MVPSSVAVTPELAVNFFHGSGRLAAKLVAGDDVGAEEQARRKNPSRISPPRDIYPCVSARAAIVSMIMIFCQIFTDRPCARLWTSLTAPRTTGSLKYCT